MSNLSINESNDNSNVSILLNKSGAQSSTNSSPNLIVFKQPEDLSIQLQQQQQQGTQEDTPEEEEEEEEMEQITQLEVQQENQPDTLSSSPFISRPNSPLDDIIRPQGTSSPSLTIRDSYSSQVDINISNLHKSLNEMRLSTDPVDNNNNNNKVNKNNPTNSDISNDDIITIDNLTPSRIQPKNISPWRQFRPTLRGSPESTPRLLFQNKPNLKFNNGLSPTNGSRDMVTNNIATTTKSREEELNKRIVNYKIQLKLMKNFLQELIDRNNLDPHEFHTLLRRNNNNIMNNENNPLSTSLSQTSTLEIQHQNLQIELDEALELNKQLYNKIETANKEISDKDLQISNYESRINLINYSVDELIYILINEYDKNNYSHGGSNTTSPGKETLQQSISAQLEVKLNVLKLELMTRLDQLHQYNNKPHDLFTPPYTSSEYGVSTNNVANKNDLEGYIHIIEDLIKTVDELELTCENYKANKNELQNQLVEQINESIRIKNNFQIMSNKFNQLRQSLSEKENDKNLDEFSKNNHQQQQQQQIQQLEQKLIEYEKCITILQDELDQYKQPSDTTNTTNNNNNNNNNNNRSSYSSYNNHRNSSLNELNLVNDYLQLQTSYSRINDELNQVNNDYKLLNSSTLEKINNLTSKLQEKSIELRNQMGLNNKLQTELNLSLDKQRKYNTERIQMSYTVDSLRKDNEALQLKVNKLTDLMTIDRTRAESNSQSTATSTSTPTPQTAPTPAPSALATVARTASTTSSSTTTTVNTNTNTTNENNNSSANIELGVKKISILEYQYKDLLLYDTNQFKRLIESYNKIADDKSLYDPKMKYEKLLNHITDINNSNGMGKNIDIIENITYIRDKHKSIFEYFIRATDILINDHIKLLLKENDDSIKVKYTKLNDKLNKLIKENESLKSELEFMNQQQQQQQQNQNQNTNFDGDDYGNTSTNNDPLSKLRMNDLRNKWKAERERRILEDQEAKKRFKELELEIQRLNEVIGNNNNNNNNNKQTTNDNN